MYIHVIATYMYVCICTVHEHTCIYIYTCMYIHVHTYVRTCITVMYSSTMYMNIRTVYICTCTCTDMYNYILCTCIYVHVYTCLECDITMVHWLPVKYGVPQRVKDTVSISGNSLQQMQHRYAVKEYIRTCTYIICTQNKPIEYNIHTCSYIYIQ